MTVARSEILKLYRSSLKAAQQFETYNFRKYFYRRTHDRFHDVLGQADSVSRVEADRALQEARSELKVMQRQALVNRLFAHNRTVIESDPQYASGARRYGE
ncbi:hypothetical protein LPJ66_001291 [Kickxella alabastrina]|uniref:Uncharacterized protein n=1 Tax=Kickxella alabastrina TaxID=61397 RepID=A0ACC1ITP2_9FUNG|nr:hypothetical protein LPJ66_001291 [Kickxella alabastrina]